MRVWTKPELIVDTMVLSQAYAAGCVIKSTVRFTFTGGKDGNFTHDWNQKFLSDNVDSGNPKDGQISSTELTNYYLTANPDGLNHGQLQKYHYLSGLPTDPSKLFDS